MMKMEKYRVLWMSGSSVMRTVPMTLEDATSVANDYIDSDTVGVELVEVLYAKHSTLKEV